MTNFTPERIADTMYKCAHCGGTFEKGWSDEEAKAEFTQMFPSYIAEGADVANVKIVCDDCYQAFTGT
jgi:ribosomal protein L37AE/L43A